MDRTRARLVKEGREREGPVVYWMSRDQRAHDNPALAFAQEMALERKRPLAVVFALAPSFRGATLRQYAFMLKGLQEVAEDLAGLRIPMHLLEKGPASLPPFLGSAGASLVVEDFDPLNTKQRWKEAVGSRITIPIWEVDAHNVVPCWLASPKQEWAARTFRPKVLGRLEVFLTEPPKVREHPYGRGEAPEGGDMVTVLDRLAIDRTVREVGVQPGRKVAERAVSQFIEHRLEHYPEDRNDPNRRGQSGLSPYLHFGTLSPQRVAWEVHRSEVSNEAKDAFLEEMVVRRELCDNFCHYNQHHDSYDGLPEWSRRTLEKHASDEREHIYSRAELEAGETHDDLWNAAQAEMVRMGKMHGYLRMYWGKKILEWSNDPRSALQDCIYLNDRFFLDGRDPIGYVNILWSIGGLHDRPWKERKVFGTVRYMSASGMRSKFDVQAYERSAQMLPGS